MPLPEGDNPLAPFHLTIFIEGEDEGDPLATHSRIVWFKKLEDAIRARDLLDEVTDFEYEVYDSNGYIIPKDL